MIKPAFIKAQVAKAISQRRTPAFLRRLVAQAVDATAREHYGATYSTKCLQASKALQTALKRFGIGSRLWMGAFCSAEIYETSSHDTWGGFWGAEHHVWLVTDFCELVDLSIAELPRHPNQKHADGVAMPAIWWNDMGAPLSVIRYLPDAVVGRICFPDQRDMDDLAEFEDAVMARLEIMLATLEVPDVRFGPLLQSSSHAQILHGQGHPWLNRAIRFQELGIPFPIWINKRIREIREAHAEGRPIPRHLSSDPANVAREN
tara:strand:- start:2740 stop:3522 length:783 start_codon:yes stop_codon:yes gene_type:complete